MKFVLRLLSAGLLLLMALQASAQSDNLSLHGKDAELLNRLDILFQNDSILNFTTVKPLDRMTVTRRIEYIDSLDRAGALHIRLSPVDRYDIRHFLMDNSDWTLHHQDSFNLKPGIFHAFYKNPAHLYTVNQPLFKLDADPVLNLMEGNERDGTGNIYQNTRGAYIRASIDQKIGLYSYVSDNQEADPLYVQQWAARHNAVPGVGFYKPFGSRGFDYWGFRGGVTFTLAKYVHVQYAYDKLFIGNGYRSLFLSDFANNALFLRLSTRLWKFRYEMIIAQTEQSVPQVGRQMKPHNYMALHHLSLQATRWLNVGAYENIMEDGKYGLQLAYLNPVIFYRAMEADLGAAGKASIGLDAKANVAKHFQFYGQLLINEFQIHQILHYSQGSYANKQALQVGAKYINALGVNNLDLQAEMDLIRPFTYTNFDSVTNFTHYNQPLADPLEASSREVVLLARYQPLPRLYLSCRMLHYLHGLDSLGTNMGGDIFRSYNSRPRDYGFFIGTGIPARSASWIFNASYEIFENGFLDLNAEYRSYNVAGQPDSHTIIGSLGFRMNIGRRRFDF